MKKIMLAALLLAPLSVEAATKSCPGVVLRDSCNLYAGCGDHPMWTKGEKDKFTSWDVVEGSAAYIVELRGAIRIENVRLQKGCTLPKKQ